MTLRPPADPVFDVVSDLGRRRLACAAPTPRYRNAIETRREAMTENDPGQQVVVAGVDGSPESIAALRWASQYAAATGATVRVVRAWHYPSAVGPAPVGLAPEAVTSEVEQHIREELSESVAQVYPDQAAARLEIRVSYGHPAEVLIGESKAADLLVVGHRGHGAFTGMLVGSVSIHCVTHASCPVVVVRGE
jgi:nucleotide-binding universal stress UspA family protein